MTVGDDATYERLVEALGEASFPAFYLEIPPALFETVIAGLSRHELVSKGQRVIVEKPFGHDLASARALSADLHKYLDESQLYRIDHLPGQDGRRGDHSICGSRTRCSSRSGTATHVAQVQITMAETFGVEGRGRFYDPVGALRDVVVNHLMQVIASTAMEPPGAGDPETLKDAKYDVFRAMADAEPRRYVRGQYHGYRGTEGVKSRSTTETYAALRLQVDNWRWGGVPFFVRTGKHLPVSADRGAPDLQAPAEAAVHLGAPPAAGAQPDRVQDRPPYGDPDRPRRAPGRPARHRRRSTST